MGYGGIARLWSVPTGALLHEYFVNVAAYRTPNADRRPVLGTRVRYSPDGRCLAISAWDEVQIYEHNTLIHHCKGFIDAPFAWSPDSRLIAGSNNSGDLIICDVQMEHIDRYTGFLTTAAEWSPDGKYILVLSDSFDYTSYLRLFNVQTKQVEQTSSGKSSVDWNPDSSEYVTNSPENLAIRSVSTGFTRVNLPNGGDPVAWHPSGRRIAAYVGSNMIAIDDATTGRLIASIAMQIPIESSVTSFHRWLVWNRDGSLLAAIDQQRVVHIWRESGVQPSDPPATNTPRPITVEATWTPVPLSQVHSPRLPSKIISRQPASAKFPWDTRSVVTLPYVQSNGVLAVDFDPTHKQWVLYDRSHPTQFLYVFRNVALNVGSRFTPDVLVQILLDDIWPIFKTLPILIFLTCKPIKLLGLSTTAVKLFA